MRAIDEGSVPRAQSGLDQTRLTPPQLGHRPQPRISIRQFALHSHARTTLALHFARYHNEQQVFIT